MKSDHANKLRRRFVFAFMTFCAAAFWSQRESAQPASVPHLLPMQTPVNAKYAGAQACASCHATHAASYHQSGMARALETCAACEVLRKQPQMTVRLGRYTYRLTRKAEQSLYSVSDGVNTIAEPILWCMGKGDAGQTYLLQRNGQWYESRVSFYRAINGLDTTLGTPAPTSLDEAFGRVLQSVETKDCFSCHATAAVRDAQLQLDQLTPGITCEACHGPGAQHVALAESGKAKAAQDKQIFNPARLSPYDLTQQFCGACHRSWEQVELMKLRGVENVRFQPYRLFYSRCYDSEDRRISCTGCHNPHEALRTGAPAYDAKCLACHQTKDGQAATSKRVPTCPKSRTNCASCHMPKYEMPGSHFKFTDHMIRVVKPGAAYPN